MGRREDVHFKTGVFTLYFIGMKQADIARLYDVTRQYVGQIVKEYSGIVA